MRWTSRIVTGVLLVLSPLGAGAEDIPSPALPPPLPAQPFFGHLTTAEGLPENTVRALLQDRAGFLWIGTQNGLVRYDGTAMRVFRPLPGDSTGIGGRSIFVLHEDPLGCIWAGTGAGGISRLDPRTGTFFNYAATNPVPGALPGRHVLGIASAPDSTLWVAMQDGGLACRTLRSAEFTAVAGPRSGATPARGDSLTSLLAARDGTLFVGFADGGVGRYEPRAKRWHLQDPRTDNPTGPRPGLITHIIQDESSRIWFATAMGLALWNSDSESLRWYRPAGEDVWGNYLNRISIDATGKLWIGSAVGLYRFDPVREEFQLFRHDPRRAGSVAPGPVLSVLCDRSGAIWTGGWQAGVSFLDPWRTRFTVLTHDADDAGSLDQDAVVSVHEGRDGTLWVGTGGVTGVDEVGRLNRRLPGQTSFTRIPLEASTRTVLAICEDSSGDLWIGTDQGLLWLPRGAAVVRPPPVLGSDAATLSSASIYALLLDRAGSLWVGSFGRGLYRIDVGKASITSYLHDPDDPQSLSQNRITRLHCDARGRVWVGTSNAGLDLFDPSTGKFRRFMEPLSGLVTITGIEDADAGEVYVATGAGLFVVRPDAGKARWLDRACGLNDVPVASMARAESGELWIHTPRGLFRCGADSTSAQAYDAYYGVPAGEMYFGSCRGRSGQLFFGSKHGLLVVDPASIRVDPNVPPVVITGLEVNDVAAGPATRGAGGHVFPFVERVVLPYDQNDLRFSFAALQLAQAERIRYRYRLQHDDRAWRSPSTQGIANYTNVSPGSYRFEVQVGTAGGGWSPTAASLEVVVTPPWWRTAWARSLYILLAIGFATLVYRMLLQRERTNTALKMERAEARHLQELDSVKSRFFANISHEFRTPLTLILGPLGRLRASADGEARGSLDMIQRNARRLGELIEQLLDLSRLEAGRLTVRWEQRDILIWLKALVSSFDSMATDRGVTLVIDSSDERSNVWFEPDLLEKIVVNLLSNAFKFTPRGGEVRVAFTVEETIVVTLPQSAQHAGRPSDIAARQIRISVANTGSYIPPESFEGIFERFHQLPEGVAAGGTGIGLALTKELVELLRGSIQVESDRERGTRFTVVVPAYLTAPVSAAVEPMVQPTALQEGVAAAPAAAPLADVADDSGPDLVSADAEDAGIDEPDGGRPRVLVIEDNADLRAFLASELNEICEVLQASDGNVGLAMGIEELPDLVLSDVLMPGIDGIELCRRLKADERTDHIPIVLLSARAEVESRLAGLSSGADDYQAKPFDPRELRLRVHNLIEERRRLRERFARQVVQLGSAAMPVASAEERFLKRACEIIDSHIDDPEFSVEQLANEIGMSKAQLLRKVRAVTGAAPRDLIRTHRLQRAANLLASGYGNVTEVSYAVGMESLSTFAKRFREQYGVAPSEYAGTLTRTSPARS